ncbi:magnesium and cobalt efflux protein CorC [Oxobacter pfennigii]|uniref:Magnesium and cobalt efflux protein CorC n=1 Tax=Oxobacter pfennigii TaxID=36849 RepID=A0A0P8YTY2_9CLOT|nr:hemolysin family protein [Oxobacter pfennigii]KPU43146.1 magnesium and cobalt efflux protein CorC [Oxobacter pfennigii]
MDIGPGSRIILELAIIFILILLNAFFAASEMAIVSSNKTKIIILANEGNTKAEYLLKLLNEPSSFLATIQVGITLAGFLASASAATSISEYLSEFISKFNIPAGEQISIVAVTLLLSYITLVLGELFPKRLALQYSEKIAMAVVRPIMFVSIMARPFIKLLTASTNLLVRMFNIHSNDLEEKVSEEEIRMMISVGEETGVINETEKEMLDGIFEFDDTLAREIMTPRTGVFTIDINAPIKDIIDSIIEEQYSRIPIFENDMDNIIGILYMKDLFKHFMKGKMDNSDIRKLLRPAYFVPETKNIDALFKELQATKNHMAILIDEYGGFAGIVTIEDLVEEVMGNIFDEHDESQESITEIDKNTYLIDGLISIDDINERFQLKLPSDNFETIGGFVVDLLGSIPSEEEDQMVEYENIKFKIEKMEDRRIEKLRMLIN